MGIGNYNVRDRDFEPRRRQPEAGVESRRGLNRQAVPEYVALDLETTGLDPLHDRVIEVGAVAFTPDRVLDQLERLVDPGRSVPEAVRRLTGIDPAQLRGAGAQGPALAALAELLRGREAVGHGARLDIEFMVAGATAIQVGTATFYHPPAAEDLLDDMARLLAEAKVTDVGQMIGTLQSNRA